MSCGDPPLEAFGLHGWALGTMGGHPLGGNLAMMRGVPPEQYSNPLAQQLGGPWGFGEQWALLQQQQQRLVSYTGALSPEDKRVFTEAEDGQYVLIGPLPAPRRESEAVRCFLRNLRRIKRALENDEGWTITEARVPLWLAKEIQRHPPSLLRASDRALCESDEMSRLLPGDELCRVHGVFIIIGSRESQIEFSYKKVA